MWRGPPERNGPPRCTLGFGNHTLFTEKDPIGLKVVLEMTGPGVTKKQSHNWREASDVILLPGLLHKAACDCVGLPIGRRGGRGREALLIRFSSTKKYKEKCKEYWDALAGNPSYKKAQKLFDLVNQWGGCQIRTIPAEKRGYFRGENEFWRAALDKDGKAGRLFFHPIDAPVRVWAVSIQPAGVIWTEAEIVRYTKRNIIVRYAGETARLDREALWEWWAVWRCVRFVSSRDGRIAQALDAAWQRRYGRAAGGVPPAPSPARISASSSLLERLR
jgi:hypothetical protein